MDVCGYLSSFVSSSLRAFPIKTFFLTISTRSNPIVSTEFYPWARIRLLSLHDCNNSQVRHISVAVLVVVRYSTISFVLPVGKFLGKTFAVSTAKIQVYGHQNSWARFFWSPSFEIFGPENLNCTVFKIFEIADVNWKISSNIPKNILMNYFSLIAM